MAGLEHATATVKTDYRQHSASVLERRLDALPAKLREIVERLYEKADSTGTTSQLIRILQTYEKTDNRFYLFFLKRTLEFAEKGYLKNDSVVSATIELIQRTPAAADSIPRFVTTVASFASASGTSLSKDAYVNLFRMARNGSRSDCPEELFERSRQRLSEVGFQTFSTLREPLTRSVDAQAAISSTKPAFVASDISVRKSVSQRPFPQPEIVTMPVSEPLIQAQLAPSLREARTLESEGARILPIHSRELTIHEVVSYAAREMPKRDVEQNAGLLRTSTSLPNPLASSSMQVVTPGISISLPIQGVTKPVIFTNLAESSTTPLIISITQATKRVSDHNVASNKPRNLTTKTNLDQVVSPTSKYAYPMKYVSPIYQFAQILFSIRNSLLSLKSQILRDIAAIKSKLKSTLAKVSRKTNSVIIQLRKLLTEINSINTFLSKLISLLRRSNKKVETKKSSKSKEIRWAGAVARKVPKASRSAQATLHSQSVFTVAKKRSASKRTKNPLADLERRLARLRQLRVRRARTAKQLLLRSPKFKKKKLVTLKTAA